MARELPLSVMWTMLTTAPYTSVRSRSRRARPTTAPNIRSACRVDGKHFCSGSLSGSDLRGGVGAGDEWTGDRSDAYTETPFRELETSRTDAVHSIKMWILPHFHWTLPSDANISRIACSKYRNPVSRWLIFISNNPSAVRSKTRKRRIIWPRFVSLFFAHSAFLCLVCLVCVHVYMFVCVYLYKRRIIWKPYDFTLHKRLNNNVDQILVCLCAREERCVVGDFVACFPCTTVYFQSHKRQTWLLARLCAGDDTSLLKAPMASNLAEFRMELYPY